MKTLIWLIIFTFAINESIAQFIPPEAKLEELATGFLQPEGPIWKDGVGLLFSDIRANKIYCWSPIDSSLSVYMNPSDSSNGLTLDLEGNLILTQMAKRRVSRRESNGDITPLATTYNGKKFNSPNDLVVKSDGSIFFTDPDFNVPNDGYGKQMGFKGIFRISPYGIVYALDSTTFGNYFTNSEPNGICFSPDESKLYVNDSPQRKIYVWNVVNDSIITGKQQLCSIPIPGYADGMKVDPYGNIYCTGPSGVWIFSPEGVCLDTILVPLNPTNCCWGDADRKTLYITAGNSYTPTSKLYRIRLSTTNVKSEGNIPIKNFELYPNYPNPYNSNTKISYTIPNSSYVSLKLYDTSGRCVATLFDGIQNTGYHTIDLCTSNLSSGIYFYQLVSGIYSKTRRMILLK